MKAEVIVVCCRNGAKCGPSILVIRDRAGHVFGCFCAEPWRVAPRYYGTGESFVFQIQVGSCLHLQHNLLLRRYKIFSTTAEERLDRPWCSEV